MQKFVVGPVVGDLWVKLSLGSRLTLFRPTFFSLSILLSSQVRRETIVGLERENPCTSFVIFHEFVRFTRIVLIKIKIEMGAASRKTSFHNEKQDVRNLPSNSPSPVACDSPSWREQPVLSRGQRLDVMTCPTSKDSIYKCSATCSSQLTICSDRN